MKYCNVLRGHQYRLLSEGRDYKEISVKGKPLFVPNYVFEGGFTEEVSIIEEEDFNE
jgi:hypothetical protein